LRSGTQCSGSLFEDYFENIQGYVAGMKTPANQGVPPTYMALDKSCYLFDIIADCNADEKNGIHREI
jgi:hypothetical protein